MSNQHIKSPAPRGERRRKEDEEMAVQESNLDVKLKLVTLVPGSDGVQKQRTTTLSNIVKNPDNDGLYTGAQAVGQLLQVTPSTIIKATEVTLSNQA